MKCELCDRETDDLHKHHLVPQKLNKHTIGNKKVGKIEYQFAESDVAMMCSDCSKMVHALHSLKQLATHFYSVRNLKESKRIQVYLKWVKDKPIGVVKHARRGWLGGKYE